MSFLINANWLVLTGGLPMTCRRQAVVKRGDGRSVEIGPRVTPKYRVDDGRRQQSGRPYVIISGNWRISKGRRRCRFILAGLAGRCALVVFHALVERKRAKALLTRVPFLAGVRPDVLGQAVTPCERLGAQVTLERLLAGMSARVLDQLVPGQERLVAYVAHVVLGGEMDLLVVDQPHFDLERLAAHVAHEWLIRVVRLFVYVNGTMAGARVPANVALE